MSEFVRLTLVRYPPRDIAAGRGRHVTRIPGLRAAAALLAVVWLPAAFHIVSAVTGDVRLPANGDAWLHLAGLALGGVPLAAGCGLLWRRGHGLGACACVALGAPAVVAGAVAADGFGPVAAGMVAAAASLPAWMLYLCGRPRRGPQG